MWGRMKSITNWGITNYEFFWCFLHHTTSIFADVFNKICERGDAWEGKNQRRRTMPCEIRPIAVDTPQNAFFTNIISCSSLIKAGEE